MKKTLKKRAFISAIAMLIVSAIVLTSSTFAWFAMATQVNVDSMELNITSLDGIVFSANTSNWTTKLTSADFANDQSSQYRYGAYVGNKNNLPEKLAPVSSPVYVKKQNPVFFSGSIDDRGYLTVTVASGESEKKAPYVAIDLFIKVATSETVTWKSTLSVNDGDIVDPLYAMRVAVVNCGQVAEKADAEAIHAKVSSDVSDATVWEMDDTKHIATAGVDNGTKYTTMPMSQGTQDPIKLGAGHVMPAGGYTKKLDANYATGDTAKTFAVTPGVTKLRVYIWLEGQDCDCESAIAGAIVKCGLSFSIVG